jgi:hypothetical protein
MHPPLPVLNVFNQCFGECDRNDLRIEVPRRTFMIYAGNTLIRAKGKQPVDCLACYTH